MEDEDKYAKIAYEAYRHSVMNGKRYNHVPGWLWEWNACTEDTRAGWREGVSAAIKAWDSEHCELLHDE